MENEAEGFSHHSPSIRAESKVNLLPSSKGRTKFALALVFFLMSRTKEENLRSSRSASVSSLIFALKTSCKRSVYFGSYFVKA